MCVCVRAHTRELPRVAWHECAYLPLQGWKGVCAGGTVSLLGRTHGWASEPQGGVSMPEAGRAMPGLRHIRHACTSHSAEGSGLCLPRGLHTGSGTRTGCISTPPPPPAGLHPRQASCPRAACLVAVSGTGRTAATPPPLLQCPSTQVSGLQEARAGPHLGPVSYTHLRAHET